MEDKSLWLLSINPTAEIAVEQEPELSGRLELSGSGSQEALSLLQLYRPKVHHSRCSVFSQHHTHIHTHTKGWRIISAQCISAFISITAISSGRCWNPC